MSGRPLSVLFLWHQHQPYYKDPLSDRYELPWVRMHAIKDYYDMVAILDDFPHIRLNINLVPSLLKQLDDYAAGKLQDRALALTTKQASDLSFEDKLFILQNFFMANWEKMIDPHPRYRELLDKRGRTIGGDDLPRVIQYFKEQDWRDLQMWFNLAWFDPYWEKNEPLIKRLLEKGKNFTEHDKLEIVALERRICGWVSAKHKELQDKGQIEITATPFYHPILPLLCDTDAARMSMPQATLPERFSHPEDAQVQIERAVRDHTARFGRPPRGMWPSEGSVSDAAATLMAKAGLQWAATDEAVLALSRRGELHGRNDLYEPYRWESGGHALNFFFRDHELSDAIGFVYTSWNSSDAVTDFIKRLHDIRTMMTQTSNPPEAPVVPVILDGENCWEYYDHDGEPFLRELYTRLTEDPLLQTVLASEYLEKHPPRRTLTSLWQGSWINANYAIWIGHAEDNRAWELLHRTRRFLVDTLNQRPELQNTAQVEEAWEEIYIAEGSDWCWWYGDDHSSANDETFDYLFRKHLMNVYTLLGASVPEDLHLAIKGKQNRHAILPPVDFIKPTLDGRVTSYFEWQSAGVYHTEAGTTGTMHRAQNLLKSIYFGFDLETLYIRIDPARPLAEIGAFEIKTIVLNQAASDCVFCF
jgi:alpha-amylase/alpha-mannosidase (GH57 family)